MQHMDGVGGMQHLKVIRKKSGLKRRWGREREKTGMNGSRCGKKRAVRTHGNGGGKEEACGEAKRSYRLTRI